MGEGPGEAGLEVDAEPLEELLLTDLVDIDLKLLLEFVQVLLLLPSHGGERGRGRRRL